MFWIKETGKTVTGLRFDQMNADMQEWNGYFQSYAGLSFLELDYRVLAGYTWLGEFIFVESEDYAYRNVRSVNGYGLHTLVGAVAQAGDISFELEGGWQVRDIGEGEVRFSGALLGIAVGWMTFAGKISGKAFLNEDDPGFYMGYDFSGQLDKAGLEISVFFEQNVNSVIGGSIALRNYQKDLRAVLTCRYGLNFPVYDLFRLEVEKTFGPFKWSFSFVPSFLENSMIGAGLTWYFDVPPAEEPVY